MPMCPRTTKLDPRAIARAGQTIRYCDAGAVGRVDLMPNIDAAPIVAALSAARAVSDGPSLDLKVPASPPDHGKPAPAATVIDRARKAYAADDDRARGFCGTWMSDRWQTVTTNGHGALLQAGDRPASEPVKNVARGAFTAPAVLRLTAGFWRAWARVRTCRPKSGAMVIVIAAERVTIRTADREAGAMAGELVPDAGIAGTPDRVIMLDDDYIWPLRGTIGAVHAAPVDPKTGEGPIWIPLSPDAGALVMPMRGDAADVTIAV